MGQGSSIVLTTYTFSLIASYRTPVDLKESFVKSIMMRIDAVSNLSVEEAVVELNNMGNAGEILFDASELDMPEN
jgi:hypothetical protein